MPVEVTLPQLGESVTEGTITKWLVKEGDSVTREQPLLEVATDKADTEVPSPVAGRVSKIVVEAGATVPVKSVLCIIEEGAAATAAPAAAPAAAAPATAPSPELPGAAGAAPAKSAFGGALAGPDTRKVAREVGIDPSTIAGSGERGRVTREDVLRAAQPSAPSSPAPAAQPATQARPAAAAPAAPPAPRPNGGTANELQALINAAMAEGKQVYVPPIPNVGFGAFKVPPYLEKPGDRIVPFSRRRRITAAHMVYSKQTAPQVVTVAEIDMQATSRLRDQHKDRYKKEGVGLTYLAFIVHATAIALKENPSLNARVLEDAFVLLRDINIGVAVDTKDGLVVPVIRRADGLNVRGIAQAIDESAMKARDGKLTPDDLSGASFSVSNPGLKGNLFGGAIINQPNVGILRIGELKKRVVVVEAGGADTIAIHPVMFMALSYDHRVVDGVAANTFLWRVRELLEKGEFEV
ncbi:MAG: 2-oxo acid dehydrogenase subunit E2 [Deltaproteobacteria bacterium]|nr:2-oxo acid dehydrogenase subunit E2 [Deltaproteobacteria bacterium]